MSSNQQNCFRISFMISPPLRIYIPFETAQAFRSWDNTFLRRGQWTDLLVEVYVRTKKL